MSTPEHVVLVDRADKPIGLCEKLEAHQRGLLHRAFSVFIFRSTEQGRELLLQQRALDKYHCAGLWTNTCCSHPRDQEPVLDAAKRRLQEEMGFCVALKPVGSFIYRAELASGLIEHELDHVFVGEFSKDSSIVINPDEVNEARWVLVSDLQISLKKNPQDYTPWFEDALGLALNKNG